MKRFLAGLAPLAVAGALLIVPTVRAGVVYDTSLASPGFYNGTGNANSNFTVDTEGNLELGLSIVNRFVGPIDPGAGSNIYDVAASGGSLASWDFQFSVNTQAGGGSNLLNTYTYAMTIQDLTAATSFGPFDPVADIPDDSGYGASGKTSGVDQTSEWGAQNAENLGFGFLPGFNPNNVDEYEITLSAYSDNVQVGSVSVFAQVTTPEPATFVLAGAALLALGWIGRRRFATRPSA